MAQAGADLGTPTSVQVPDDLGGLEDDLGGEADVDAVKAHSRLQ